MKSINSYCYMQYFLEREFIHNSLVKRGKVIVPSSEYIQFKLHIIEIGALDLTEPENRKNIPTKYWKCAINLNFHIFPIDKNYIKNVLYRDKVFNLPSQYLESRVIEQPYIALKLTVLHEEIRTNIRNNPQTLKNTEYLVCTFLGVLYRDFFRELDNNDHKVLSRQRPFVQLWFDHVRTK